jgi:rhodanese-related sulfurtransferase
LNAAISIKNEFNVMRKYLIFLLCLIASHTCSASSAADKQLNSRIDTLYEAIASKVDDVPTVSANALLRQKTATIFVDVREPRERAVSRIPGAISLEQLPAIYRTNPRPVVVYCTIGYRSGLSTRELRAKGIPASNLRGGILAWIANGGQLIDAKQKQTHRVHVYAKNWAAVPENYSAVY